MEGVRFAQVFPDVSTLGERELNTARIIERSPEKAGVGGSTPSRGTIPLNNLAVSKIGSTGTKRNSIVGEFTS